MSDKNWVRDLFISIDAKDLETFSSFLSAECCFRFGNLPELTGADEVGRFVGGFFDSILGLKHEISDIWEIPGGVICHGMVSYTRLDRSVLRVPFSNIFEIDNGRARRYLIFADTSQLYAG